jgi:hypothetical protein
MPQFVLVGKKYINLNYVSHVEVEQNEILHVSYKDPSKASPELLACRKDDPGHQRLLMILEGR